MGTLTPDAVMVKVVLVHVRRQGGGTGGNSASTLLTKAAQIFIPKTSFADCHRVTLCKTGTLGKRSGLHEALPRHGNRTDLRF